ncbi:unnamed protein product [Cercopithifilaria johnstoni]|uniref:Uncharacterized protein n=1 Tax=Cercopithifilaria johnstoni TaxID=2874296 RepID=A0A8J2MTJ3_9BILA|nr:unnamed protein product [Cercopithifilaria johnstoni]
MGLGTVIDISATPVSSEQFIMRSIKNDCDAETADMSNDQITTTLRSSSLLLDRNMSPPEVKDTLSSEHSNLRHGMQLSEAHEDVPSDPFVFSTHQLKGNQMCSTNGTNTILAAEQPLESRCFDSSNCPHDPEPSTSKEGLASKETGNEQKDQALSLINGKYNLKTSIDIGKSSQIAANDSKEPDKDVTTQLYISVPSGNRNQHVESTDLSRQISPAVLKQEPFPAIDVHQGVPRRSLINTAPLSPNHYGSILAQTPLPFRVNKRSQLSGSHKTSVLSSANEILVRSETNSREISADVKEVQQKKQKIQEERIMTAHFVPSSSVPIVNAGEDHLQIPSEQILNKALDLLRKPAQDDANEPRTATKRSCPKKISSSTVMDYKDGLYRKILQEKIGKLRDKNGLALSVPHLERAHLSQLVNLLQRFKNHFTLNDFLSKEVSDHVFGDGSAVIEKLVQDARNPVSGESDERLAKYVMDADVTESEDSDEENEGQMPSTSSAYLPFGSLSSHAYFDERVSLGTLDAKALCIEEDCEEKINVVYRQLNNIRKQKTKVYSWNDEALNECCARCLPYDGKRRRFLKRRKVERIGKNGLIEHDTPISLDTGERVRAYATVDNRVYPPLPSLAAVPIERGAEVYCRRRSTRPIIHLRKRFDRSPWTTFLEERKVVVKEAVIVDDRQTRRKRERTESEESYDDDEEYQPATNYSQRGSYSKRPSTLKRAGQNLVGRSFDRKRNGDFRNRRFTNHRLRLLRTNDVEDGLVEPMPGLPQKIDYKEICIPHWERKTLELVPEEGLGCMHLAECSCVANISRRHLPYELNERKRFQQYRDYVAAKSASTASKLSGSSHSKLPATSTAPSATGSAESLSLLESVQSGSAAPSPATLYFAFDDDQLSSNNGESISVPEYDRPSMVSPYSPRIFSVPLLAGSHSMKNENK